jgi:hypothetical protein
MVAILKAKLDLSIEASLGSNDKNDSMVDVFLTYCKRI